MTIKAYTDNQLTVVVEDGSLGLLKTAYLDGKELPMPAEGANVQLVHSADSFTTATITFIPSSVEVVTESELRERQTKE